MREQVRISGRLMREVRSLAVGLILAGCAVGCSDGSVDRAVALTDVDDWLDMPAPALAAELAAGRLSAEDVTRATLARIAALDDAGPQFNAVIETNPDALTIARELDRRFAASGPVGPLHGVPVALKANIDTADRMATSAGSLALADNHADEDAAIVARLRAAGAVIVAKANLSEWANFRGSRSSSGWSSLGGQTKNPWALDRSPCGSSSGSAVAVAVRMVPLAVGTETDGSIVCPAAVNGIVGIKPTHGSVDMRGIVPIAHSQDVAGPMARTVRGAALLLSVLQDSGPAITERTDLAGVRIGVLRDYYGAGANAALEARFTRWLDVLRQRGATLLDPIELDLPASVRDLEFEVLLTEFRTDVEEYLRRDPAWPDTLAELIEFNQRNAATVMPHFGQELFEMAQLRGSLDSPEYAAAVAGSQGLMRARLAEIFAVQQLDALVAPVTGQAWPIDWRDGDDFSVSSAYVAALSGYPSVAVPGDVIERLPVAAAFIGRPNDEARLLGIAAVFEAARGPLPSP